MGDKVRGRLLEAGSYVIAAAIAVAAFGHCLFGTCLTGSGIAQAAGAAVSTKAAGTATAGQARNSGDQPAKPANKAAAKRAKVIARDFEISGMFCAGCADHVSAAVRKVPGVKDVEIDYETGKGTITFEEGKVDPDKLIGAIKKAGYKARPAG